MPARQLPFYVRDDDAPAKREILRAALKLFSERGLAATSIRDIARESGYTNPALYKHFASKDELALHLFETCHRRVWARCNAALSESGFPQKLERYVGEWLALIDENSEVIAFLEDSARVLWPRASATVRRQTMIGLAQSLVREMPQQRSRRSAVATELVAAAVQGTLGEVARMIQVGVLARPATKWKRGLVALFRELAA